jgi:hypothetical protein
MKRLLVLTISLALVFLGLACGDGGSEVASPQPTSSTASATPRQPTATAESTSPEVATMSWEEAISHVGEQGTVCGPVVHTDYLSASQGQPTYLDIGISYLDPEHFTVVIWGNSRSNFPSPPEDAYAGATVCVTGFIEPYEEAAGVIVDSPSDIVVQAAPEPERPTAEPATPEPAPPQPQPQPQPTKHPLPDFSPFAKNWGRHGFGITVTTSGEATASWRVYKWCSDDPTPPCDDMTDSEIRDGGYATLIFDSVSGSAAYGTVLDTNDPELLSGQVTLTLQPYDMALLESAGYSMTLCGPNFWQEAPESLRQESPCGA